MTREKFWQSVVVAYVMSGNSTSAESMIAWADRALKEFDLRFPNHWEKGNEG